MINDKVDKVNEKLFESLHKGGKVKHELRVTSSNSRVTIKYVRNKGNGGGHLRSVQVPTEGGGGVAKLVIR